VDHLTDRADKPGEGPAPFDDGTAVPDLPAHTYVTADELAATLGVAVTDPWVLPACVTATAIIDQFVGPDGVARWLGTVTPVPDPARLAALTVAVDVYRRRSAAAGYFDVNGYLARLALDPAAAVSALLAPYLLDLGVG
jgi:hypothetical protein